MSIETGTNLETLVDQYLDARRAQEELETSIKQLSITLLQALESEQVKMKMVNGHRLTKVERVDFKLTLEEAKALKATQTVEQINKDVLKLMYKQGVPIPGTVTTAYVRVG